MLSTLRASTYDDRTGWEGVKYTGWNQNDARWNNGWKSVGAEGPQGFLHWYWPVQRHARSRRLNGCVYNYIQGFMCPRVDALAELNALAVVVHKPFCVKHTQRLTPEAPLARFEYVGENDRHRKDSVGCFKGGGEPAHATPPWLVFPGMAFSARTDLMPQDLANAIEEVSRRFNGNMTAAMLAVAADQAGHVARQGSPQPTSL